MENMNLSPEDKKMRAEMVKLYKKMLPEKSRAGLAEQTRGFLNDAGLPYTQNTLNTLIEGIRFYIALSSASEQVSKFYLISLMEQVEGLEKSAPANPVN
jgi:hypothetical protein